MTLSIYTIQETLFEGKVTSITLPTPDGEINILENHLPIISLVSSGTIQFILEDNQQRSLSFPGGIVEVRPESEVVILEQEVSNVVEKTP